MDTTCTCVFGHHLYVCVAGLLVLGVGERVNGDDLYSITENTDNIFLCDDYTDLESFDLRLQILSRMKYFSEFSGLPFITPNSHQAHPRIRVSRSQHTKNWCHTCKRKSK